MSEARSSINILLLLNRVPYPLNDGGAIGAYNFIKGYSEAGCRLHVLFMNTTRHYVPEETVLKEFGKYATTKCVKVDNRITLQGAFLNLFKRHSYIAERFISAAYEKQLIQTLSEQKFDVVHMDGIYPCLYIPLVRVHSNAKIVLRAHNVEHVIWKRIATETKNFLKKFYLPLQADRLSKFETSAFKQCDLIMAISKDDEQIINSLAPGIRTVIVPAGMDIAEKLPLQYLQHDLFFIGSLDWMPNLQGLDWFFENIWNTVRTRFPDMKLFIAGKKMPQHIYERKSEQVIPVGEVPDSKHFILEHGIMLVPLISGSGIRIKIVEAMALGKVIIATNIAAEGLGLTDGENILIANTPEEFVTQIEKCNNDAFRNRLAANAHRFALENFQNKRIFQNLLKEL